MDWLLVVLGSCIVLGNVTRSFMMTSQSSSAGVAWRKFWWLKMSSEEEVSSLNRPLHPQQPMNVTKYPNNRIELLFGGNGHIDIFSHYFPLVTK